MYDGSLCGHWQAIVTLQQLIVLCDIDGVVDMTPQAISQRTSIPLDIIQAGIEHLEKPDAYSRTKDLDGRRIEPLDDRGWGWRIVNYKKFRHLKDTETVRAENAERQRRHRASQSVTSGSTPSLQVEAEVEVDVNKKTTLSGKPDVVPVEQKKNGKEYKAEAVEILQFLNAKTGRAYRPVDPNILPIVARLKSGATVQDCKTVIARKHREWSTNDKMEKFLRPKTLFAASNFENYLGECVANDKPKFGGAI
jgi:uncharacterized phage protein (TIGR02220 family)